MQSLHPQVLVNGSWNGEFRSNYSLHQVFNTSSAPGVPLGYNHSRPGPMAGGGEAWGYDTTDGPYPAPEAQTGEETFPTELPFHFFDPAWNFTWEFNWTYGNLSLSLEDALGGEPPDLASIVVKGIILGLLVMMTIGGNVLVLLAVFANSHLRGTTHYFIANLAVADLLLGTTVLPFSASLEIINYWAFGQLFCDIWAAVDVLCCTASIMSLCVISIDRYIGVTRPLQHSTIMSEKRAGLIILSVWLLSIAISVGPLAGWGDEQPSEDPTICEVTKQLGYVLFSVSGSFYIPLIIILIVYFRVYREALSQSKFLSTGMKTMAESNHEVTLRVHTGRASVGGPANKTGAYQSSSSSEHSEESGRKHHSKMTLAGKMAKFKREKKAAKTLGLVVGMFILCWFPFFFVLPLESLCGSCFIPGWLFKIIFWLGYFNSMMNPIIYACSSREFRRAFIRILQCQWRRRPRQFLYQPPSSQTHASVRNGTEMSTLARFRSTVKKVTQRERELEKKRNNRNGRASTGGNFFNRQNCNHKTRLKGESPISSLRLLHDRHRKEALDSIGVSDDESALHEVSEEEKSDAENEMTVLVEARAAPKPAHTDDGDDEQCPTRPTPASASITTPLCQQGAGTRRPTTALVHQMIPDIVIDEVYGEALGKEAFSRLGQLPTASVGANMPPEQPHPLYQVDDDNIMWL